MTAIRHPLLTWTTVVPVFALLVLGVSWGRALPAVPAVLVAIVLVGAVLAAVHHAEVVAHRVGEPFGSLVLAVAVTVIEVGLIVTLMVSGKGDDTATLARDTVFAAAMRTTTTTADTAGGGCLPQVTARTTRPATGAMTVQL